MSIKIHELVSYTGTAATGLGANSTDTSAGDAFVTKTAGIVTKATSSGPIVGVSITQKALASDNQTVDKYNIDYIPTTVEILYDVTITGGSVTVASEEAYFNLTDSVTVNGASSSSTTGQLKLVKFVSATNSVFAIANK